MGRTGGRRVYLSADGQGIKSGSGSIEQGVIAAGGKIEERAGTIKRSREALQFPEKRETTKKVIKVCPTPSH